MTRMKPPQMLWKLRRSSILTFKIFILIGCKIPRLHPRVALSSGHLSVFANIKEKTKVPEECECSTGFELSSVCMCLGRPCLSAKWNWVYEARSFPRTLCCRSALMCSCAFFPRHISPLLFWLLPLLPMVQITHVPAAFPLSHLLCPCFCFLCLPIPWNFCKTRNHKKPSFKNQI